MAPSFPILLTLLLALSVSATPLTVARDAHTLVSLPIAKRVNVTGVAQIVKADQARAKQLKARALGQGHQGKRAGSEPVENQGVTYVAPVAIGSPATTYSLIIDTGSSNTWAGAGTAYARTSTTKDTLNIVSVTYGSGNFEGQEVTDLVSLGDGLTIENQSVGAAFYSEGFSGVDGILGIGPVDLTEGTLIPSVTSTIPTVTDNLFTQGVIGAHEVSVYFQPTNQANVTNGELTFGGTDSSKYVGEINYTPLTTTSSASNYWGINQAISYGSTTILSETAGIVDTGTTLVLIATDAFNAYVNATGATSDSATGLYKITAAQYANLQSLYFIINGVSYELVPNAQIWPRALNSAIGGTADSIYLILSDIGSNSGSGLDFINGFAFLERYYSVFDTAGSRVGFANTSYTTAETN
ncbi:aspartic peptidase A1 [Neolentinus lepideus HHB14362 ss-1]|uniref:Aspartic peptidase A1 n=1 Tax=Neolentinus lepideus HHB14362 ss-1 TaxID=1314782 RepID=A0A165MRT0_9AGAM|nr:aspartic peptidase A1 [Neolentinus lepideus HHB14362 ss-1]